MTAEAVSKRFASDKRAAIAVLAVLLAAIVAFRLHLAATLPLWLDETWTGMIVTRPDWAGFWREVRLDVNAPLYYVFMKGWTALAGDSNLALRLPSVLFSSLAAIAPLVLRVPGLGSTGRLTWAALMLLWLPGAFVAVDARAYALLLLLAVLSVVAFARLYDELRMRSAIWWVALCSLLFLTHYFSVPLILAQVIVLLARHRLALMRLWPAGLVGLPALAWFAYHFPRLQDYARPDAAWYERTDLAAAWKYAKFVVGPPSSLFVLLLVAVLAYGWWSARESRQADSVSPAQPGSPNGLRAAAWASLLGLAITLGIGVARASLTERYLIPLVPGALLGAVLIAQRAQKRAAISALLVIVSAFSALNLANISREAFNRHSYGYEQASAFLIGQAPTDLVFTWDHPNAKILDRQSLASVGSYFFQRSGNGIAATSVALNPNEDPHAVLAKQATGTRPALIWIYNTRRASAARAHPPAFASDPTWNCTSSSRPSGPNGAVLGTIACVKRDSNDV